MFKKKKNIDWLTVVTRDAVGGAEQLQRNLITFLAEKENKCLVIVLSKRRTGFWKDLENQAEVVYFPFKSHVMGYLYLTLYLTWVRLNYRIAYSYTSQSQINSLIGIYKKLGILKNTKIILRESTSIFKRELGALSKIKYRLSYKLGYSIADLVICQTDYMKDELLKEITWLEDATEVTVIPNPIYTKEIEEKSKLVVPGLESENFIVTAGRMIPEKGYDILINAFSKIYPSLNNCKLYILGAGPERKNLEEQIQNLGLTDKVVLPGMVSNVYPYFKHAQLCVMSSRIEGFPNVLLQMMSQNENVVSTLSAGGIDKLEGLYTVPTNNEDELGKAMLECFNMDNSEKRKIFDGILKSRSFDAFVEKITSKVRP